MLLHTRRNTLRINRALSLFHLQDYIEMHDQQNIKSTGFWLVRLKERCCLDHLDLGLRCEAN